MSDYRRLYIPGGWYFFTLVTHQRRPYLTATAWPQLKLAFRSAALRMPYRMPAIVVLPDHLHCIWSLPAGDAEHSRRWQFIKASFARRQRDCGAATETPIWQARYWEHWLRDEADVRKHLDYIHYNPVKHGHVSRPADWRFSSFGRYVERGVYPPDWGAMEPEGLGRMDVE